MWYGMQYVYVIYAAPNAKIGSTEGKTIITGMI